ncbi:hypothetical protein FA13DRAFT_1788700 [Coprinellus micaceus]|uniref:SAGA-associated factor 11 n=1 Tax=Coprinellus micaceus TaxID=71717 RepID=A0A4Y7TLQ6_COPMI|nr:hypothetical protein FA13DRAFT_1788700 [Coprinellus micaceus]
MPKSEREETISSLSSLILSSILDELVMDAALSAHHEIARAGAVCQVCKAKCNAVHIPPSLANMSASSSQLVVPSRSGTPSSTGDKGTGTSTPTNGKGEGGILYLECLQCSRQISSNRYAPHLSSCMGLSHSRRGAPRTNSRARPSEAGRSASPASDMGYGSDDRSPNKGKGRDDDSYSLKRKRGTSPQISPTKKLKNKPQSPVSRLKAEGDGSGVASNQPTYSSSTHPNPRIPSKLRDSSTAPYTRDRSPGSSSSRDSSPGAGPTPSATSSFTQSPSLSNRVVPGRERQEGGGGPGGGPRGRGRPLGSGTGPPKRSPPMQVPVQRPPVPQVIHGHFGMDVDEGEETGSSTDTSDNSS